MAYTYTGAKSSLDEIADRTTRNRERLAALQTEALQVASDLNQMSSDYAGVNTGINDAATAAPGDTAIQAQKAEKDKLLADFQALKTQADSVVTDLTPYDFS